MKCETLTLWFIQSVFRQICSQRCSYAIVTASQLFHKHNNRGIVIDHAVVSEYPTKRSIFIRVKILLWEILVGWKSCCWIFDIFAMISYLDTNFKKQNSIMFKSVNLTIPSQVAKMSSVCTTFISLVHRNRTSVQYNFPVFVKKYFRSNSQLNRPSELLYHYGAGSHLKPHNSTDTYHRRETWHRLASRWHYSA